MLREHGPIDVLLQAGQPTFVDATAMSFSPESPRTFAMLGTHTYNRPLIPQNWTNQPGNGLQKSSMQGSSTPTCR